MRLIQKNLINNNKAMAERKGLDGSFMKYGIPQADMTIIESVCQAEDVDKDWLEEEILAPYQKRKNSGAKITVENVSKILKDALKKL